MQKKLNIFILLIISIFMLSSCFSSSKFVLKKEHMLINKKTRLHPPVKVEEIADVGDVGYRSSFFIYKGRLYVGNLEGDIYEVDLKNKQKTKIISLKGEAVESTPYAKNEFLYIGTDKANFYKINYIQKKVVKKVSFDFPIMNSVYERNGILYVISEDDTIRAVDPDDLGIIWKYSNGEPSVFDIRSTAGIMFADDGMYCGFSDGSVSKISYYGDKIWTSQIGEGSMFIDSDTTPNGSNRIFVSSVNGYTEALEPVDGSVLWKRKIPTYSNMEDNIFGLFLSDENGNIIALDNDNGETMWKKKISEDGNVYSLKLVGNYIYAITEKGVLVVLDALKGKVMDIVDLDENFSSRFVLYNDKLYTISRDGSIYSIESK